MKDWLKNKATELADNVKSVEIGNKKIGDYTKPVENFIGNEVEKHNESKKEHKITLQQKKALSKQTQPFVIRKDLNNLYYLSNRYDENSQRYNFERISWNGSTFSQTTKTNGEAKTQGRMGSALIGGALAGPVGATIGSARKRKSKINTTSKTTTTEEGSEVVIYLRNISDDSIKEVKAIATTSVFNNIQQFFS